MKLRRIMAVGIIPMMYKVYFRFLKRDDDLDSIAANNGAYQYLKRYAKFLVPRYDNDNLIPIADTEYVWVCWLQGIQNAPLLVQHCIESIKHHCRNKTAVVITDENVSDYIAIPAYIQEKRNAGRMSRTHFSDIVRIMLLSRYGGIWLDSTILLTGVIPDYILELPFFVFRSWKTVGSVSCATGFMASCPHHPIIEDVQTLLFEYWKKENRLISYSVIHLFITLAIESRSENKGLWKAVPIYNYADNELLRMALNEQYDDSRFEKIKMLTPIHKLTYKFDEYHINPAKKGTFYDVLMHAE